MELTNIGRVTPMLDPMGPMLDAKLAELRLNPCFYATSQFSTLIWHYILRNHSRLDPVSIDVGPPLADLAAWSCFDRRAHLFFCSYSEIEALANNLGRDEDPVDIMVYVLRICGSQLHHLIVNYSTFPDYDSIRQIGSRIKHHCTSLERLEVVGPREGIEVPWLRIVPNKLRFVKYLSFMSLPRLFSDEVIGRFFDVCGMCLEDVCIIGMDIDGVCLDKIPCIRRLVLLKNESCSLLALHLCKYLRNINPQLRALETDIQNINLTDCCVGLQLCESLLVCPRVFNIRDAFAVGSLRKLKMLSVDLRISNLSLEQHEITALIHGIVYQEEVDSVTIRMPFRSGFTLESMRMFKMMRNTHNLCLLGIMQTMHNDELYYHLGKMENLDHLELDIENANLTRLSRNLKQISSLRLRTVYAVPQMVIHPMWNLSILDLQIDTNHGSLVQKIITDLCTPTLEKITLRLNHDVELPSNFWQKFVSFRELRTVEFYAPVQRLDFFYEFARLPPLRHLSFLVENKNYRHHMSMERILRMIDMSPWLRTLQIMNCEEDFKHILENIMKTLNRDKLSLLLHSRDLLHHYEHNIANDFVWRPIERFC